MCSVKKKVSRGISEDTSTGTKAVPLEDPFRLHRQSVNKEYISMHRKPIKHTRKSPTPQHILPRLLLLLLLLLPRLSHCSLSH